MTGSRPGTIGRRMPSAVAAVAEAEEVVVVVEQLRDDDVGAGIDFALEIGEIDFRAGRFLVRFRVAGDGDAEVGELAADQRDQLVGVAKSAGHRPKRGVAAGRIAAEGDDVFDVSSRGPCAGIRGADRPCGRRR